MHLPLAIAAATLLVTHLVASSEASRRPNILFIGIDDQNDWIGVLGGHPQARTPNIDRLAARGTLFTNAHCQSPLCNPSRASLLTGLRPSTTGIHGLRPGIREVDTTKEVITLPQTFTRAGYRTFSTGKIFHDGSLRSGDRAAEFNVWGPTPPPNWPTMRVAKLPGTPHPLMDWGPLPARDEDMADYKVADAAIEALRAAPSDQPFFIACGFRLPHVPCVAPSAWFDLHPLEQVKLPPMRSDDRDDTPRFSWYLHWNLPEPRRSTLEAAQELKLLVRAYLATSSFMDAQVGRLLAALEASGRAEETLVVLWSDHGYHLGEKGISGKNSLWERSTRVPLIFAGPGVAAGARCNRAVELLDIYPTLLELTSLPARDTLEGHSLVPLLKDADAPRSWPAITTHNQGNHAVRDEAWRYIHYADGSEELCHLSTDPNEWINLALEPKHAAKKSELRRWLPKHDRPAAPRSAERILTYDPASGQVTWENQLIGKDDPIPAP